MYQKHPACKIPFHNFYHIGNIELGLTIYKQMNMVRHNLHGQNLEFIFFCKVL